MNIYNNEFHLIGDAVHWPNPSSPKLVPNPLIICVSDKPKSTRIWNKMDWREGQEESLRCRLCTQPGHNHGIYPSHRSN